MGIPVLFSENYEKPAFNLQSLKFSYLLLSSACKNPTTSVRLEPNGKKSWKTTTVLIGLEEAKTEFREAEIVSRSSDPCVVGLYLSEMGSEESQL